MTSFTDYREHVGSRPDKVFKSTLFEGERLMLGLNCLDPGQEQRIHTHPSQDKFYFVLEGEGTFVVGEETSVCGAGHAIGALAGVEHGVTNHGTEPLVMLVGMGPPPAQ